MTPNHRPIFCLLLAASALLAGCAHVTTTKTGFLGDYSQLKPPAENAHQLVYSRPDWKAAVYPQVWIEPTVVQLAPKDAKKITAAESDELRTYADAALRKMLMEHRAVVGQAAPATLRVRAAITGVDTSNPTVNVMTGVLLWPLDYGGVSLEFEVLDATTGTQIVALVAFSAGTPIQVIGSFSKLGHARSGIDRWVAELKKLLAPPTELAKAPAASGGQRGS